MKEKRLLTFFVVMIVLCLTLTLPVNAETEILSDATAFTESEKNLLVAKPSVVQVTNIITGSVVMQSVVATQLEAPELAGRSYDFSIGMSGSGFFVTGDGYLITNGHVANPDDDLVAYFGIAATTEEIFKDAVAILVETYYGYSATDEQLENAFQVQLESTYKGDIQNLIDEFYTGYRAGELDIDNVKNNNYIQLGSVSGRKETIEEEGIAATLVDSPYEGTSDPSDLALLKIDGSNFPTIELGSSENVQKDTEVYAIGYPAVVEQYIGEFTDVESGLKPFITKGTISSKKKLAGDTEVFQTDAGIAHGNSGGPIVDMDGNLLGVATWGYGDSPSDEGFNFLLSVEDVKNLLEKNNIASSKSSTTQRWEEALNEYSNKCYRKAKSKFEEAKSLYANNVDVDEFISKCQTAIANGEDACGFQIETWMYIAAGAVCCAGLLFVVGAVVLFFIIRKRSKK